MTFEELRSEFPEYHIFLNQVEEMDCDFLVTVYDRHQDALIKNAMCMWAHDYSHLTQIVLPRLRNRLALLTGRIEGE